MWHTEHFHQYADDINIYTSLSSCSADLKQLTLCTSSLQHWLWHNWLLLNPDKSVAALFGTRQCLARPAWPTHVAVVGSDIKKCPTIWRFSVSHSTRRWRSTLKWYRQSRLVIFISSPCDSPGALCLVMLHRASLVPSYDRGWITATPCITACQTPIFKGYRECRMLLHELFAKLQNANITQPTFWRISIGYLCTAELTTRMKIAVLCYKAVKLQQPSYLTCLFECMRSSTSDLLSTQSSSTNIASRRFSCCAPTVWNSLPSFVRTADSFTSFRSQLKTIHICSRNIL